MDRATIKMFIDQCDGMGLAGAADCVESVAAEVERLQAELQRAEMECACVKREVAASQARELQLRDELFAVLMQDMSGDKARLKVEEFKSDTSALEALIARAGEVMRERCAVAYKQETATWKAWPQAGAAERKGMGVIRALPDVKLEDLK